MKVLMGRKLFPSIIEICGDLKILGVVQTEKFVNLAHLETFFHYPNPKKGLQLSHHLS